MITERMVAQGWTASMVPFQWMRLSNAGSFLAAGSPRCHTERVIFTADLESNHSTRSNQSRPARKATAKTAPFTPLHVPRLPRAHNNNYCYVLLIHTAKQGPTCGHARYQMGNCKSKPSAANAPNTNGLVATYLKPPSKLPPFTASTDLFLELGVPLLGRPSPNELLQLFHEHDTDHNDVLNVTEVHLFLQAVSNAYGNGSWGKTSGSSSSRKNLPSNALLGEKNVLSRDEILSALWDRPVFRVPSPIVLLFREEFRKRLPKDGRTSALTRVEASKLARRLLVAAHVTKDDANAVSKHMLDAPSVSAVGNGKASSAASEGNQVTLEDFVASVGPAYTALSPNHNAFVGLEDDIDGDLSLGTKIRSFAPVRDDTSVEILNCGEAIMRSILHVLDEATTEICMSWFDFVHDLPAVRSESLGANAWSNESGTLPSLLRQKASKGVKVYIMLWNSLDLVMPTAHMPFETSANSIQTLPRYGRITPRAECVDSHPSPKGCGCRPKSGNCRRTRLGV